jgi:hypothetical protein
MIGPASHVRSGADVFAGGLGVFGLMKIERNYGTE